MLRIRLFRVGKKNQPFFKIVVVDKKSPPRGGRPLEILGFYNPLTKEKSFKKERIQYWLSVGAKPSDTIYNLLVANGVLKGKKVTVHKKPKEKKEEKEKPKKAVKKLEEKKEEKASESKEAEPIQGEEKESAKPKEEKIKEGPEQEKIKQEGAIERKLEKKVDEKEEK